MLLIYTLGEVFGCVSANQPEDSELDDVELKTIFDLLRDECDMSDEDIDFLFDNCEEKDLVIRR